MEKMIQNLNNDTLMVCLVVMVTWLSWPRLIVLGLIDKKRKKRTEGYGLILRFLI